MRAGDDLLQVIGATKKIPIVGGVTVVPQYIETLKQVVISVAVGWRLLPKIFQLCIMAKIKDQFSFILINPTLCLK